MRALPDTVSDSILSLCPFHSVVARAPCPHPRGATLAHIWLRARGEDTDKDGAQTRGATRCTLFTWREAISTARPPIESANTHPSFTCTMCSEMTDMDGAEQSPQHGMLRPASSGSIPNSQPVPFRLQCYWPAPCALVPREAALHVSIHLRSRVLARALAQLLLSSAPRGQLRTDHVRSRLSYSL